MKRPSKVRKAGGQRIRSERSGRSGAQRGTTTSRRTVRSTRRASTARSQPARTSRMRSRSRSTSGGRY